MDRPTLVTPGCAWPLHDGAATRRIEQTAAASLPAHTLMQRAGLAVARLAVAVAPHARRIWIACGPGNNGGDGLEAATHLQAWGWQPVVTCLPATGPLPEDAAASRARAQAAGVRLADAPPADADLVIDALFGIGAGRGREGQAAAWRDLMRDLATTKGAVVLSVDLPSGLDADTGTGQAVRATHTLSLLTIKPGLFTAQGRDAAGQVWWDDLGVTTGPSSGTATAMLSAAPSRSPRLHDSHKGSWGDVAVVGGATGMTGAAVLAARAALRAGAGRVFVGLLQDPSAPPVPFDPGHPELMLRDPGGLDYTALHVACGCGGGDAVHPLLPRVISRARSLVLDADALNALARDVSLQTLLRARCDRDTPAPRTRADAAGATTVLTPHPLEAARLLETTAAQIQADRLAAARALSERWGGGVVVVLKGSGTVIAQAGRAAWINPTGNARLATAGTGDVLAGMIAARLAQGEEAFTAAAAAVYEHGLAAQAWPADQPFTASTMA